MWKNTRRHDECDHGSTRKVRGIESQRSLRRAARLRAETEKRKDKDEAGLYSS
jgi:hypothetical protein